MNLTVNLNRKFFLVFSILTLCAYGFMVSAVGPFTPGEMLDPTSSDGCSGPTDTDCIVRQAWTQNVASSYVYNTTENVGIGIATPTAKLNVRGADDLVGTSAILLENSSGTDLFIVRNTGTLEAASTHTGLVAGTNKALNSFSGSIIPDASVNASEYYGVRSAITYDPTSTGLDLTYSTQNGVDEAQMNVASGFFLTTLTGTGDVARATGSSSILYISGTGSYSANMTGSVSSAILASAVTVPLATAHDGKLIATAGTITRGKGLAASVASYGGIITTGVGGVFVVDGDAASSGTERIIDAMSLEINARNASSTASGITIWTNTSASPNTPAIQATTTAYGIRIDGVSGTVSAITSATTYGIFIASDGLTGTTAEYGLYINDTTAENYFVNGVRIGADSNNNKLSSATAGTLSTTLYIGTNTIDTTAPSDERTKQNITDTSFGLDDLNAINIVDFTYDQDIIDDNNKQHTGVLAQQVQAIYPEAVLTRSDDYLMVDYKTFIPLIMKSVQELSLQLDAIQSVADGLNTPTGLIAWLGDVANGITLIIADTIKARNELCIDDVCITRDQLAELLDNNITVSNTGSDEPVPLDEPTDEPVIDEPIIDEVPAPEPEPSPEPEPESEPEPTPEPAPEPSI